MPDSCTSQLDIASQLVSSRVNFNITFGGGEKHFNARKDNQNLIEQWLKRDATCYVNTKGTNCNVDVNKFESSCFIKLVYLYYGIDIEQFVRISKDIWTNCSYFETTSELSRPRCQNKTPNWTLRIKWSSRNN